MRRETKSEHGPARLSDELAAAKMIWPHLNAIQNSQLKLLLEMSFCVSTGDLQLIENRWYVTHSGLLRLARKNHCNGIETEVVQNLSAPAQKRWVVKATVFKTPRCKGFVGYGDADPSNVSPLVRGAEMRVAETRAVNRALRKAYGIGLCSVEELGDGRSRAQSSTAAEVCGTTGNGKSRLRDRLLLLLRVHRLDGALVKRYAAQFCGTDSLRKATREQVESFINHLAARAAEDRDKLIAEMSGVDNSSEPVSERKEQSSNSDGEEAA